MDFLWTQEKYTKALKFAAKYHNNQKVPGTDFPYIIHPVNVAMEILAALPFEKKISDPDLCVECALLHDVIEDTKADYDTVLSLFGKKTAAGVLALSKNKDFSDKTKAMKDSLKRIKEQPFEIWLVKIADRISNLCKPPLYWNNEKTENYSKEAVLILNELGKGSDYLSKRLEQKIEEYKSYWK